MRGGRLRLRVASDASGRSFAAQQEFSGALRVIRPHYLDDSGQVTYTVINPGGAYFGADSYSLDFDVEDAASLLVTTQSATKVYRTPQGPAVQRMRVNVGRDATFEYLPDQLIVYREGTYRQESVVVIEPSSRLVMGEIVTPGWSPEGTAFSFDELRMRTELRLAAPGGVRPVAVDNLRLIPAAGDLGMGVMEGYSHSGQLIVAGPHLASRADALADAVDTARSPNLHCAISRIGAPWPGAPAAFSIRSLASNTADIAALNAAVVEMCREADGRGPLRLRKY